MSSGTLNSLGPGIIVDAAEQLVDSVTISLGPPIDGSLGHMSLFYTLVGTNIATGTDAHAGFGPLGVLYVAKMLCMRTSQQFRC